MKYFKIPIFWVKEIYIDGIELYDECCKNFRSLVTLSNDLRFYSTLQRPSKPESYVRYNNLMDEFRRGLDDAFIPEYLAIKQENGNFYEMVTNKKICPCYEEDITYAFASEEKIYNYINSDDYADKIVNYLNSLGISLDSCILKLRKECE